MTDALREAAQQALEALEGVITDLRAAKAESERDWSLLAATQESLREHMAEVQRLRAALAQPATIAEWWAAKQAASGEPVAQYSDIVSDGGFDPRNAAPQPAPAPAASGEPVAWIQPDHLQKAKRAPFLCRVEPTQRCADFVPLYTAQPAPARVPRTLTEEQLERHGISASECPPNSQVMLVSSIRRLLGYAGTPAKEAP